MAGMNGRSARHELERQRCREFEAQEREKRGRELDRAILDAERRLARTQGRIDALPEQVRANPELTEALRLRAWAKTGKVQACAADPQALSAPEGWPESTDEQGIIFRPRGTRVQSPQSKCQKFHRR